MSRISNASCLDSEGGRAAIARSVVASNVAHCAADAAVVSGTKPAARARNRGRREAVKRDATLEATVDLEASKERPSRLARRCWRPSGAPPRFRRLNDLGRSALVSTDLLSDLQRTLGAGYRVTRELAGGGMSRVFVAEEELLEREIVVKLLPPDLMAGLSVERFRAEIQHAVKLQHPHIIPVLSAGVITYGDGVRGPYYTMPFIRGETLRARLERNGALPPDEVRRILMDVVDALAHAHDAGIVHRDIKPDNVFLVRKNALVTDFGVSKALMPPKGQAAVTGVGMTLGTPGYMAPEQAAGDPGLDHRADLYAVGILAYELLTTRRPFVGSSIQELLVAQAVETPIPLQQLCPGVPAGLAVLVMRCLEKRPEDRFTDAHELLAALEQLPSGTLGTPPLPGRAPRGATRRTRRVLAAGALLALSALGGWGLWRGGGAALTGPGSGHIASVALLPPEYFQPDSAVSATLADLVDHISNSLGQVKGLKVVNYMSVSALYRRGKFPSFREIGEALDVEHLVVFAPRLSSRGERVAVQFIEAPTQAQLWVTPYSPDSANFDDIVADVVSRVSHALLGPSAQLPLSAHSARARREGAHEEFLAGKQALRRRTPQGVSEAIRDFEQAIRLDSTHADALGRLATALGLQLSYGYRTTDAGYPTAARALDLAEQAIALDPARGELVGFRAYIEYLTLAPLAQVRADFERAISLHAAEADVAGWHALMLLREGKTEESLAESRRALDLDPISSARHLTLALAALGARRYDLAGLEARRASETEPELRRPREVEALALLLQNRGAECAAMDLQPYFGVKAMCLRAAGRGREAQRLVDSLARLVLSEGAADAVYSDVIPAQELATWYAWIGNPAECLKYLRLAFARSPVGIDLRIVQSGVYDPVRRAKGFQVELQRLQDAVWPRVIEQQRRLRDADGTTPLAALVPTHPRS
jgi:TolB-like protein/tetratricopeptide (TPR) repeat protein